MKKGLLLFALIFISATALVAQQVSIINKKFVINGNASCPIYFNGTNTPWDNWNDFGGNYDASFWSAHFATLKANGINATRVWISCNGDVQPNINTDGTVTGVSNQFWANADDFFQSAQNNGIYVMATMMSFDHTKNTYNKYQSWRNMLNDQAKVQSYCTNYLVPFVNRYKTNPYLMSIDISNEIEWVAEDANNMKCSYAVLQRFVAMCASAIHNNPRTDGTTVLVTMGSAATKWNATKMRAGANGAWSQNNSDGNKWSDAALKAQYNQANAILDFYSPHYYAWIDTYYSNPYVRTPTDFGIDEKAVLIGETPAGNPGTPNLTPLASYHALKNNGYQGHFPWTSNGVDSNGGIEKFGADAKTFSTTYSALVKPACTAVCATVAPTVTTPVSYCKDESAAALTATGTALKWYADNTTATAFAATPVPSTATAGTTDYYVSQTLNGCESPRALLAVTVKELPAATVTTTAPTTFCTGGSVLLAANTGAGLTYVWKKNNAQISGVTTASYAAMETGSYTVTVTANGCSKTSDTKAVTVTALPTAPGVATPVVYCKNAVPVAVTATGTALKWYADNTTATAFTATPVPSTATAGTTDYYVSQTLNGCESPRALLAVTVKDLPSATVTTTAPTTFCTGGSILLAANTGAGLTYVWKKNNAQVSGVTTASYAASETGSYTVTVTANGCSKTSDTKAVTVTALPTAPGVATPVVYCKNAVPVAVTATGTALKWYADNTTATAFAATPVPSTATAGTTNYYVSQTLNGCEGPRALLAVTVKDLPAATVTTTAPTTFCAGNKVSLAANTGSGLTYVWKKDNAVLSGSTSSAYSASETGSYTVTVTANGCSKTSDIKAVTVTTAATWYQDLDGDGKGDASVTQAACAKPTGYVSVAGDACPSDPNKQIAGDCGCGTAEGTCTDCAGVINGTAALDVCAICSGGTTGIPPVTDLAECGGPVTGTKSGVIRELSIYPNPSSTDFTISVAGSFTITLYNAAGKLISTDTYDTAAHIGEGLDAGMYVIRIEQNGITETKKIIKE